MTEPAPRSAWEDDPASGVADPLAITGWHVVFWLLWGLGVLTQVLPHEAHKKTGLALALLAVLGATYVATIGHSRRRVTGPPAVLYLVVAVLVTGAVCALDSQLTILLFLVYPQIWMYTNSLLAGVLFTVALSVSTVVGSLVQYGVNDESVRDWVPNMVAGTFFSIVLGLWITRVVRQSRERASLIAQLEATRAELAQAHHAQGVAAERERLAREIHDTLAQGFTSVIMLAQAARGGLDGAGTTSAAQRPDTIERLDAIEDVARENLAEARALVAAFSPVGLDGATLVDALARLAERFGRETGLDVRVEASGEVSGLPLDRQVVLVRAAQEALTNVRRHANASRVVLRLVGDAEGARVEVEDDGVGFEVQDAPAGGFGLDGMRGRAQEVGGGVRIESGPGAGTLVSVRVPAVSGGDGESPARGRHADRERASRDGEGRPA